MSTKKNHMMPESFSIRLRRSVKRDHGSAKDQLELISQNSISQISAHWNYIVEMEPSVEVEGLTTHVGVLNFERTNSHRNRVAEDIILIKEAVKRESSKGNFKAIPWVLIDEEGNALHINDINDKNNPFSGEFIGWDSLHDYFMNRKDHLWNASDKVINKHPCFAHIYGLESQIRICMDAIYAAIENKGLVCHHILLFGDPGAAKTTLGQALCEYIGMCLDDVPMKCSAWLNVDSSTGAGIQEAFLRRWGQVNGIPPIIGFEEAEKVNESVWKSMLGALDSRQRMTKLTARRADSQVTKFLAIATVNNKEMFDSFLGGFRINGEMHPGALSSRFSTVCEVSRPSRDVMYKVLMREINTYGWKEEWAEAALKVAEMLNTTDPREILRFLDGKDRLLNGDYIRDIIATRMAKEKNRETYNLEHEKEIDNVFAQLYSQGLNPNPKLLKKIGAL